MALVAVGKLDERRLARLSELSGGLLPSRSGDQAHDDAAVIASAFSALVGLQRRNGVGAKMTIPIQSPDFSIFREPRLLLLVVRVRIP